MKKFFVRFREDHKGLTLVELLVAVTILAIVSAFMLHGMILAARTNSKAKIQHKATTLAQNVFEGMKSNNMDNIVQQFADQSLFAVPYAFDVISPAFFEGGNPNHAADPGVPGDSPQVGSYGSYALSDAITKEYQGYQDQKEYYFYMEDVLMEQKPYDVLIEVNRSAYGGKDESGNLVTSSKGQDFNSQMSVQIPVMDGAYDAVISQSVDSYSGTPGFDSVARTKLAGDTGLPTLQYMDRELTVNISDVLMVGGNHRNIVSTHYKYTAKNASGIPFTHEPTDEYVFNNTDTEEHDLRNLYIFFRPMYGMHDTITINNPDDFDTDIYLIKLESDGMTIARENAYKITVNVVESEEMAKSHISLHTNLNTNLVDPNAHPVQLQLQKNGSASALEEYKPSVNGLADEELFDRIFDVKIFVYPSIDTDLSSFGSFTDAKSALGDSLAEFSGTIRN